MILDVSSLIPALSFCIYIPFIIFGLANKKALFSKCIELLPCSREW